MKQRPVRKILALVLSLLLVFAFTPAAFAEEPVVAKIGDVEYKTVQEAVEAVAKGDASGTIDMVADSTEDVTIPADATITLNIAEGVTLTNANGHTITNNGTLNITGSGTVDNVKHGKAALHNERSAKCTVNGCTFIRSNEVGTNADDNGENSYYTMQNYGMMTINDCTVYNKGSYSSLLHNGYQSGTSENNTPTLTINGGLFSGGLNTIKNDDRGILYFNNGTVENVAQAAILNWNETTIAGGDFKINEGTGVAVVLNGYLDPNIDKGELSITGGDFSSATGVDAIQQMGGSAHIGDIEISGGDLNGNINIAGSRGGSLSISGDAQITGTISASEGTDVGITGGTFSEQPKEEYIDNNLMAQIDGDKYYVGNAATTAISGAKETITVLNGTEITGVPEGVKVTNKTKAEITVDGTKVEAGNDYTVPTTQEPEPSNPSSSFTEPEYYPDYDEDVDYLPPVEDEEEEEKAPLYMVTCRTLNVRMGPGTSYAKLGTLSRGTLISGEYENGWVKFTYNGVTAYSSADYLMQVDGDLSGLHVTCRTLNVRAGAGTNFDILGTLSRGTEISVRDVLPGWYEIDFLGGIGYVSSAYIG